MKSLLKTYAKIDLAMHEEEQGIRLGLIDVFVPNGMFVKHFASNDTLNAHQYFTADIDDEQHGVFGYVMYK